MGRAMARATAREPVCSWVQEPERPKGGASGVQKGQLWEGPLAPKKGGAQGSRLEEWSAMTRVLHSAARSELSLEKEKAGAWAVATEKAWEHCLGLQKETAKALHSAAR